MLSEARAPVNKKNYQHYFQRLLLEVFLPGKEERFTSFLKAKEWSAVTLVMAVTWHCFGLPSLQQCQLEARTLPHLVIAKRWLLFQEVQKQDLLKNLFLSSQNHPWEEAFLKRENRMCLYLTKTTHITKERVLPTKRTVVVKRDATPLVLSGQQPPNWCPHLVVCQIP